MPQEPARTPGRTGVFISYSHKDLAILERIKQFFAPLERAGSMQYWDDTQIKPGMDWHAEIRTALMNARVAILLISADFLASAFIVEDELPSLLAAAEKKGTVIMPLIVGPSAFSNVASLSRFQAVNDPKKPLKKLSSVQRDEIFAKLADTVRSTLGAQSSIALQPPGPPVSNGVVATANQMGSEAQSAAEKEAALQWLRDAAEAGNAKAQAELGAWYALGMMTEQNYPEAFKWLTTAAEKGSAAAQFNLAKLYANGKGVEKDTAKGFQFLMMAAQQGHADAQYYVGQAYREGDDVSQDLAKAREWYAKAAQQGQLNALNNLGAMFQLGLGGPKDEAGAVNCTRQAAEAGDASAQHNLGIMYRNGYGVAADPAEAYQWFRKSAAQGYAEGQAQVGNHLANGWGVQQNYEEAVQWFQKAAEQGNASAQFNLSVCYGKGQGVPVDFAKALAWVRRAADQGYAQAKELLDSLVK